MVMHTESQVRWNVPPGRLECSDAADTQRVVKYNWHFLLTLDTVERITKFQLTQCPGCRLLTDLFKLRFAFRVNVVG